MKKKRKRGPVLTLIIIAMVAFGGIYLYKKFFAAVSLKDKNYMYLYIERNDELPEIVDKIKNEGIVKDAESFEWLALKMDLHHHVHPGKYRITNGMTMRKIINLLKYNKEEKVKLFLNAQIHDMDEFIAYADGKLALTSDELEDFLTDEKKLHAYFKLDPENSMALLVPHVHEVSWAITVEDLFDVLQASYNALWTSERIAAAKRIGLSVPEVATLASIVQNESAIESEQRKIAGVYINRLRNKMPLQADPTLKFANKNYTDHRVYDKDKKINSPYNTYKYAGLPPGPISLVGQQAIDATLNYQKHNYLYFCAKPELNGYSDFSVTYQEHQKCAAAYHKALDKLGIGR